ncbi:MAG: hypothetical protein HKN24_05990 [Acidimicrobiales bacterium]|nr:hypothetical protein [Acidimicrobiales bacterium]
MSKLFAPPNTGHLAAIFVAFLARIILGGIPLVGGLISFVLLLVILYHVAKVAMNMIRFAAASS